MGRWFTYTSSDISVKLADMVCQALGYHKHTALMKKSNSIYEITKMIVNFYAMDSKKSRKHNDITSDALRGIFIECATIGHGS